MQALIQEAKEENDNNQNDDFKKTIGFHDQNISHARASRFFVHFFDVHCTSYDVKPPNLMFYGGRGHTTTDFPSSF